MAGLTDERSSSEASVGGTAQEVGSVSQGERAVDTRRYSSNRRCYDQIECKVPWLLHRVSMVASVASDGPQTPRKIVQGAIHGSIATDRRRWQRTLGCLPATRRTDFRCEMI